VRNQLGIANSVDVGLGTDVGMEDGQKVCVR
jgi:hypothetical protein